MKVEVWDGADFTGGWASKERHDIVMIYKYVLVHSPSWLIVDVHVANETSLLSLP